MNNARRKSLGEVQAKVEEAMELLQGLREEEEEYKDNMPENMQGGERYERAESAIDAMQEGIDALENAIASIEESAE